MLDWLNHNAGAVQATGSILAALLTLILVAITWQYIRLTKSLADVAYAQHFTDLQLRFDYTIRVWFDGERLMIQPHFINQSTTTIRLKEMYILAFHPLCVRPVPKRLSLFGRLLAPGEHLNPATELDPAYIPVVKETEKDQCGVFKANHYHFAVYVNFTDLRGALRHCCFWTDIGTIHYQPSFYSPPSRLQAWIQSKRDAKERRRMTGS
jgi:hypothetical protein